MDLDIGAWTKKGIFNHLSSGKSPIVQIYYLHHNRIYNLIYHRHMLQMILQLLNIILHLSQVQILINIYNMPQHLLSICTGCKYSSVSCVSFLFLSVDLRLAQCFIRLRDNCWLSSNGKVELKNFEFKLFWVFSGFSWSMIDDPCMILLTQKYMAWSEYTTPWKIRSTTTGTFASAKSPHLLSCQCGFHDQVGGVQDPDSDSRWYLGCISGVMNRCGIFSSFSWSALSSRSI